MCKAQLDAGKKVMILFTTFLVRTTAPFWACDLNELPRSSSFGAFFAKTIFYQDRLGSNIGKTEGKRRRFLLQVVLFIFFNVLLAMMQVSDPIKLSTDLFR